MSSGKHEVDDHAATQVLSEDHRHMPHDPNATDVLGDEYRREIEREFPSADRSKGSRSPDGDLAK